jgi:oligosaccharide repeat unit polymerase
MSKRVGLFLLVGLYLVISFTTGSVSKLFVLMLAMTILVIYDKYYAVTKKSKRREFLLMIAGIALMLAAFSFANKDRGSYDADDGVSGYSAQGITWTGATRFFMPYMYLTNAWTNLQYVTETQDSRTYGLWMAKPVLGYLQLDDSFGPIYNLESYSSFNTFGFITCGFKDFGYWLSVISALMLGFFVKKIYSRFLLSRSPFDVACYVLVGLATLEMFFSNHFFMQSYPFTVVIIMGLYKFVAARLFRNKRTSNQSIVSA